MMILLVRVRLRSSVCRSVQDAWALGLVLWEMMSPDASARPFTGGGGPTDDGYARGTFIFLVLHLQMRVRSCALTPLITRG
jgi:hypothetical protein